MTCKACKWYGVRPDARGRFVVRRGSVWPCKAPEPEPPCLPSSVLKAVDWRWPPRRSYMQGDEGSDCPAFEPRKHHG